MQREFWELRWQENQTGFHLNEINPYLKAHWQAVTNAQKGQVFVPLCGKSLDLVWLQQQGYSVTAVECSEIAVKAFFHEQGIVPEISQQGAFKCFRSTGLCIYQGDYFQLEAPMLRDISLVYDRASLVAMPDAMRKAYAEKMMALLPVSVSMLLIALEYDQLLMTGPPFSVIHEQVLELYKQGFSVEKLQQQDIIQQQPRFRERGLNSMIESVYKLTSL